MVSGGHASGAAVDGVIISFTIVGAILTVLRLYTRKAIVQTAGMDDMFICLGVILSILLTITMAEQVNYGMGRHESSLSMNDGVMSLRWFWASVWIYYLALWSVKMSILFQYLRILPENGGYRKACYILMGVVSAWTLWAFFSAVFACMPINSFWDTTIKGACLDRLAVWFANAAVNILTDICTTVLPLPILNTLRIPKRQKYILMVVFGLGGITCFLSILRLQSLYVISKSTDISWDNPLAAMWSSLEVNVGIICSCIPTLKGLLSRIFPGLAAGEPYFGSGDAPSRSVESRPDRVDFNNLGHEVPEQDIEKATATTTEVYELGNPSIAHLPVPQRISSTLPPRASLSTPPSAARMLENWLGKEIRHTRTETVETNETSSTDETKVDATRNDSESTISLCDKHYE